MRPALAAGLACLLTHAAMAAPAWADPILEMPRGAVQGQALVLRLRSGDRLGPVQASLLRRTPSGKETLLSRASGLERRLASGEWAALAFLALPLSVPTGTYLVRVRAEWQGQAWEAEAPLEVAARIRAAMDIKLSPELTSLRASPDPRKDAEARELSDILAARRPGADSIDGPFVRPLRELAVSATFADTRRYLYSNGQSAESLHYGIDLYQEAGCPVAASGGGRVVLAKARIVTGNTVVIEHAEGLYSLYYHLERIDVAVGDLLHAGSPLGSVGSTGLATGPHLHWELRLYGEAVDPESLVGNALLEGMRVR